MSEGGKVTFWQSLLDNWMGALSVAIVGACTYLVRQVLTNKTSIKVLEDSLERSKQDLKEIKYEVKDLNNFLRDNFVKR